VVTEILDIHKDWVLQLLVIIADGTYRVVAAIIALLRADLISKYLFGGRLVTFLLVKWRKAY
jgi:hypothetical protein